MNRQTLVLGLVGIALAFMTAPSAAQSVYVDVGVHARPIAGRVVYGAPVVYADYGGYGANHHVHHSVHGHRHLKHGHHAGRQHHKRLHRRDRAYARADGLHSHYCRH